MLFSCISFCALDIEQEVNVHKHVKLIHALVEQGSNSSTPVPLCLLE